MFAGGSYPSGALLLIRRGEFRTVLGDPLVDRAQARHRQRLERSHLEARTGALGETVLRSDGGVVFELVLPSRPVRHPVWWSAEEAHLYHVSCRMPGATGGELAFSIEGEES